MAATPSTVLRERLYELIEDPKYRRYVFAYLLSCLDERHWDDLVQAALQYGEDVEAIKAEGRARASAVQAERG